jgi:hypothetical protein
MYAEEGGRGSQREDALRPGFLRSKEGHPCRGLGELSLGLHKLLRPRS